MVFELDHHLFLGFDKRILDLFGFQLDFLVVSLLFIESFELEGVSLQNPVSSYVK